MKVLIGNRIMLYGILNSCFQSLEISPRIAEIGVLNGKNAEVMVQIFSPSYTYLIDSWSSEIFKDYRDTNKHREWVDDISTYSFYFGGDVNNQATFDNLYDEVQKLFLHKKNVKIIRGSSFDGLKKLKLELGTSKLDLIYLDASHQYETVFDDLMYYKDLISENGVFQLNDCCYSDLGVRQNLGVLEAVTKFVKMTNFIPVVITNTDWSDIVLIREGYMMINKLNQVISDGNFSYVEIPNQLLGAAVVKTGKMHNLSFC